MGLYECILFNDVALAKKYIDLNQKCLTHDCILQNIEVAKNMKKNKIANYLTEIAKTF